jgi:hypothetical protein
VQRADWIGRTLGSGEVDDVAVALEHVHLLNCLDGLHVELLQGSLELLVVVGASGDSPSLLLSGGSLTAYDSPSVFARSRHVRRRSAQIVGDVPVRAGAAPPNFFFRISCTSAMFAVVSRMSL